MRRAPAFRATRVPEGTGASRHGDRQVFQVPALWPGITWGRNALCSCSWAYRDGVAQVKVRSGACTVHIGGREPGPEPAPAPVPEYELPPPAEPPDAALLAACQSGTVTRELYDAALESWHAGREAPRPVAPALGPVIALIAEAADEAGWLGYTGCGTHEGYNKHAYDKTPACPGCEDAERVYSRDRKRAQVRARNDQALLEAA